MIVIMTIRQRNYSKNCELLCPERYHRNENKGGVRETILRLGAKYSVLTDPILNQTIISFIYL